MTSGNVERGTPSPKQLMADRKNGKVQKIPKAQIFRLCEAHIMTITVSEFQNVSIFKKVKTFSENRKCFNNFAG